MKVWKVTGSGNYMWGEFIVIAESPQHALDVIDKCSVQQDTFTRLTCTLGGVQELKELQPVSLTPMVVTNFVHIE